MDVLGQVELWVGRLGGVAIISALGIIFQGIFMGIRRFREQGGPREPQLLLRPLFYVLGGAAFFAFCWWIWKPLPFNFSAVFRIAGLVVGAPFLFAGIGLIVWGRLELDRQYFVSTGRGAKLFAEHQLVTSGPFAIIRHPMYLGILLVGLGGTLLYRTWTMVFIIFMFLGLQLRTRREEEALSSAFGDQWSEYIRSVPRWLQKIKKRN